MTKGRKSCTSGDPCEPRNLAESLYCAVHHSAIDARTIAERIGVRVGYLLDAANPDRDDMQFQSRHLIPLMTVTGNLLPLRFLAHQMGCLVVAMPSEMPSTDAIYETFSLAVSRIGDGGDSIRQALSDKSIDEAERDQICADLDGAMSSIAQIKQMVVSRTTKTGGQQ